MRDDEAPDTDRNKLSYEGKNINVINLFVKFSIKLLTWSK